MHIYFATQSTFFTLITKTNNAMLVQNKRRIGIVFTVAFLLLIPLVAVQFTNEVNWTLLDFGVATLLLLGTGLLCELVLRKVRTVNLRVTLCAALLLALAIVWIQLAVGIF